MMKQSTQRSRTWLPVALLALCGLVVYGTATTMAQTSVNLVATHSEAALASKLGQEAY